MTAKPRSAESVLQAEFLIARAKILELAATLDRLDRAEGTLADHPQMKLLKSALALLDRPSPDRAEQVQLLMSRPYDPQWRNSIQVTSRAV
jgi:hypothetical protein